jgi:hypothetical protein
MKSNKCYYLLILILFLYSCTSTKIYKGTIFYSMQENGDGGSYYIHKYHAIEAIRSPVTEAQGSLTINADLKQLLQDNKVVEDTPAIELGPHDQPDKLDILYFGEKKFPKDKQHFSYYSGAWGIQALTIPLKFRPAVDDKSKYPNNVETGINVGFAGGFKFTLNDYTTRKNIWNKNSVAYSLTTGALMGLGGTSLKAAANAPGISPDRTSPTFTYGGFILFGINNINIGYAAGFDNIMGVGKHYWVYQNKLWQGVIISLDILKF